MDDTMVQTVARVGKTLGIDPIVVLADGGDPLLVDIRIACAKVIQEDERKQNEEQSRGMKRGGGGSRPRGRGRR